MITFRTFFFNYKYKFHIHISLTIYFFIIWGKKCQYICLKMKNNYKKYKKLQNMKNIINAEIHDLISNLYILDIYNIFLN